MILTDLSAYAYELHNTRLFIFPGPKGWNPTKVGVRMGEDVVHKRLTCQGGFWAACLWATLGPFSQVPCLIASPVERLYWEGSQDVWTSSNFHDQELATAVSSLPGYLFITYYFLTFLKTSFLMQTIFKGFIELVTLFFFFFFFSNFWIFGHEACEILALWPGTQPTTPALEGEVLTTRLLGKSQAIHLATDFSNKMPLQGRSLPEEDGWEEEARVVGSYCKWFEEEMKTEEVLSERTGCTWAAAVNRGKFSLFDEASWLSWSHWVKPLHWRERAVLSKGNRVYWA